MGSFIKLGIAGAVLFALFYVFFAAMVFVAMNAAGRPRTKRRRWRK